MEIHDDYYDGNYGVAYQYIDKIYVGIGTEKTEGRIHLAYARRDKQPAPKQQ